jgi:hypothetical protein
MCRLFVGIALLALIFLAPGSGLAQTLPSGPATALDGRLAVGAEVVATFGNKDDIAFFNYTDYEHNTLRMFRVALSAAWRPASRLALVGEIRSEDLNQVRPYAAYLRVRPWLAHAFDIQIGRIPPAFGAFGRRTYQNTENPLIGYPLAYQYLTSLRPDAVPATVADLISMRARGWRATYPIGSQEPATGVPLISAFRWDTGVQGHWENALMDLTAAITAGTLSDPRVGDNNGGKQISGRAAFRPATGFIVGASAARGDFLADSVVDMVPQATGSHAQTAFGTDAEYSRDHWIVRGELVWSRWNIPFVFPPSNHDLDALGAWVEGRYRLTPRIYLAGRADHLGFSRIPVGQTFTPTWDAPVTRFEADGGYYVQRNLIVRLAVQYNDRDGGRVRTRTYFSGQIAYWF